MLPAPPGHDEHEEARLAELTGYRPAGASREPALDRVAEPAAELFRAPVALVSFVGRDRQTFEACIGLDVCETGREVSFCAHAVAAAGADALVVPDALLDPRFRDNPLVTGAPRIRFYAGAPLVAPSGRKLGALCVIDTEPRPEGLTERGRRLLAGLAGLAMDRLERRRAEAARAAGAVRFQRMADSSPAAMVCADARGAITAWNAAAERLFGHTAAEAIGRPLDLVIPERLRPAHAEGMRRLAAGRPPRAIGRTVEMPARRRDGSEVPVALSLSTWLEDGRPAFGAIMADVTERRAAEERQRLLVAELNHRVKNTLAIVLGIADQTRRATEGSGAAGAGHGPFHADFRSRLLALSRAHDLLTRDAWRGAALDEVVGGALAPHAPPPGVGVSDGLASGPSRVAVAGPPVRLAPEPAVALAMAFHELASNAVKHGALAVPGGRVAVCWRPAAGGGALEVGWTETGGPPVAPPRRRGFGVGLLERGLARQLAGEVALDFAPAGLHCRMRLPLSERVALG